MPICHDCGEEIIWVRRNGKLVPCDPWPANHYTNRKHIEAVRGKNPKAKKKAKKKEPPSKSLVELMSLNMSEEDADKIIKANPGMSDDELIMAALIAKEAPDGDVHTN